VSNGYTSKCSAPYWSNTIFNFFDIRTLWRPALSARMSSKIRKGGLDKYDAERFRKLSFVTIR